MVHAQHPPVHPVEHESSAAAEPRGAESVERLPEASRDVQLAWLLVLELGARARAERAASVRTGFAFRAGRWLELGAQPSPAIATIEPEVWLDGAHARLEGTRGLSAEAHALLELFAPLLSGVRAHELVIGHLGQSLDGRVATPTGASQFITGHEDLVHTHRLRALFDAVIVGVRTVELDDPQLTTRLVSGAHPTRVVLDPQAKLLGTERKLLEAGSAPTLVFTTREALPREERRGAVTWLSTASSGGRFELAALLSALRARGLRRLFVEGGGVTVSSFLSAGLLDRLHVSVAPLILGSGAPAFSLPPIDGLDEAVQLRCRHHVLGRDLLFDCELVKNTTPWA
jgi:diaminohydroxyphosphoribosylaminopyrimidine deaminase/5-amino-6-(5-phosphoribosylamino)uracil reductase